jgi:hypothetical protein
MPTRGRHERCNFAVLQEVRGSWDEIIPFDVLRKKFPGAANLTQTVSAEILQHRNLTYFGVALATIVLLLGFTVLLIARAH